MLKGECDMLPEREREREVRERQQVTCCLPLTSTRRPAGLLVVELRDSVRKGAFPQRVFIQGFFF
jgi:hypothetical protein